MRRSRQRPANGTSNDSIAEEPSATHPGVHVTRVIATHGSTQTRAARALGISFQRLNAIINERRGVTPDTALRLEKLFGVSAGFWLTSQLAWDLWHQMREESTISAVG
ncbi:MAG: HigA family addiction module antitoxin [Gammaproteobacteria bacterium]|nr:HigA family addiction module antitoxin [Gammaproteobacteria bacterium]MDE0651524.1 HigA family addiction module antitoxin [Gammaproteobacteria bacterium]